MKETKFYLITDPHYFAPKLGCSGPEYDDFMHYEQKCFAETASINRSVIDYLKEAKEADNVLIAGDLSFNGEIESHREFIALLSELRESGKNVYVVTADHDFKDDNETFAFGENGRYSPKGTKRETLPELYKDFGFGQAIAEDRENLSYVAQIGEGVRLLALNSDFTKGSAHYFREEQLRWIEKQAEKAREDGQMLFAMNHYPILGGQPLMALIKPMCSYESYETASFFADNGINLIFTGHMHNQSINCIESKKGNKFFDVCTGAIIADPAYIRLVTIKDEKTVEVESIPTPDFDFDTKGKDCKQYLSDLFDNMIVNVFTDMRDDTQRMMNKFHLGDDAKLRFALKLAGKFVCGVKLSTLARLIFIKCPDSLKKVTLLSYATDVVRHMFEGNQPFVEGSDEGDLFIAFLKRIRPILRKIDLKNPDGTKADLFDVLKNTAGNYGVDDYNATLILK